ncbi:MAG: sulfatase-like hydrolase/transferase, partial [Anaerolineae bacterium]|nr:sulfatase-like hydrolase/transferase [Anaerolineae bacterium]
MTLSTLDNRPNILIIHADQHRFDCLGAYGNSDIQTPNIDQLAQDGIKFDNSFCSFPVCTPSRYSFLSGQYVRQHAGWTNHSTLAPGIPTFPKILRDAGYVTAAVGKMHFTPTYLDVGFQHMQLAEQDGPGRYDDDYHRWLMAQDLCDHVDLMDQVREYRNQATPAYWDTMGAMQSDLDEAHHSTTWIADRAQEQLDTWGAGGNLMMVGFIKPHHPFDPPEPWTNQYNADELSILPGWLADPLQRDIAYSKGYFPHADLTEAKLKRVMAHYYATISQIDFHVGRMISKLKKRGLYKNSLILYTSDHGDYMGYHHLLLKGNYMYDPLIKVPLIIKLPGQERAGQSTSSLVSNLDIAPTLLSIAGCDIPNTMRGLDLSKPNAGRDIIFAEGWAGQEIMVRTA